MRGIHKLNKRLTGRLRQVYAGEVSSETKRPNHARAVIYTLDVCSADMAVNEVDGMHAFLHALLVVTIVAFLLCLPFAMTRKTQVARTRRERR